MAKVLHINSVAVDRAHAKAKNARMTPEERARVGKKLRDLRLLRRLSQVEVVQAMPKGYRISVATLQAIEGVWRPVRDTKIECYAAYFDTSSTALLREDEPRPLQPTDPLLQDLHEEHLEIAQRYMRARKQVRASVELLLENQRAINAQLAALVLELATWSPANLALAEAAFENADLSEHVLAPIFQRLAADPEFLDVAKRLSNVPPPEEPATPSATDLPSTDASSKTRRD